MADVVDGLRRVTVRIMGAASQGRRCFARAKPAACCAARRGREVVRQQNGAAWISVSSTCRRRRLKRLGEPEEFAPLVVFLASDQARYITGQTISVDGGLTRTIL